MEMIGKGLKGDAAVLLHIDLEFSYKQEQAGCYRCASKNDKSGLLYQANDRRGYFVRATRVHSGDFSIGGGQVETS